MASNNRDIEELETVGLRELPNDPAMRGIVTENEIREALGYPPRETYP